ncbi:MAG: hypothetical protein H6563_15335 [Lewinellaceae bacterium]|nr:hypothetical protein [Lewinellaceae bacterium]
MKMFLVPSLLLCSSLLFSQNVSEKWVHGYLDFGYEEWNLPDVSIGGKTLMNSHYEWGFRNLALGFFKMRNKGWYHEISLTQLRFEVVDDVNEVTVSVLPGMEPTDGERTTSAGLGFQIETGVMASKWLGGFFRPGIGLGAAPEGGYFRYTPKTSQRFPFREWSALLGFNLVPRLHFRITERVALLAVVPVRYCTTRLSFEKIEDAALTKKQRIINTFNFDLGLGLNFARLGVAVKL